MGNFADLLFSAFYRQFGWFEEQLLPRRLWPAVDFARELTPKPNLKKGIRFSQ